MAKIDLAAITKGLQKVQDKATAMETVAHDELVDADLIFFAENNPYRTPEELYEKFLDSVYAASVS